MEERLQKILSHAGIASRREAERWILEGRVRVNGQEVKSLGTKADPRKDRIEVDGRAIPSSPPPVYLLLNKPRGVVTTLRDPEGRRTILSLLGDVGTRVFPVGRLDYDAEGVLLLTNDGELAHLLLHPSKGIHRTYWVKVKGIPTSEDMRRLKSGVTIDGILLRSSVARIQKVLKANSWIEMVLQEGRNREIKRLCEAIGHPVLRIVRRRFSFLTAGTLRPGEYRHLTPREVESLRSVVLDAQGIGGKDRGPKREGQGARIKDRGARGKAEGNPPKRRQASG